MRFAVLAALAFSTGCVEIQLGPGHPWHKVSHLRGGLEPRRAVPQRTATRSSCAANKREATQGAKRPPLQQKGSGFFRKTQDAVSVLAVLSLIAAAQLGSPLVETLPCKMKGVGWMGYGGGFALSVYVALRLLNAQRARQLCDAVFGASVMESALQHALPALFFALGSVGSMLCLPEGAGWQRKQMIKMGMAVAYDFKRLLGTTVLIGSALALSNRVGSSLAK